MRDKSCVFCKIVAGEIEADIVLRDEHVVAFHDANPVAPVHILVIPTMHAAHLSEFASMHDSAGSTRLLAAAAEVGSKFGPSGYRIVANEGLDAGQTVHHLHVHVLAGRHLTWPPG